MLVYLLLAGFAFIVTPKEVYHEHSHSDYSDHDGSVHLDEDCFACDFDLSFLNAQIPHISSASLRVFFLPVESQKVWHAQSELKSATSRGPPAFS
ncbi:MAG: hypothetical protein A3D92_19605 [Bacteroidetes bacterium RIFCSPHIGHO2_02_FULL_44_7]|nr:MAG: hypothetical protein A3D92_19605 [Bacteroidetes bacterium RIFCSPHIGHO2_02_FULL_44_7]